jgi:RNA polymerase sigma-70 factor, ECF subfamily
MQPRRDEPSTSTIPTTSEMNRATDPFSDAEALIRRVYGYAAYRLGDGPDAEDVTSETFERALRYRARFDPELGTPVSWLLGIARHVVADVVARRPPISTGEVPDVEAPSNDPLVGIDLRRALARLDERDRELVSLRYGADLTARQIAELLDMRTNAVEVAMHRALGRLRRYVQG